VASFYLLMVFPFDFAHLADPLPISFRSFLFWVSDDLARLILTIGVVAGAAGAIYHAVAYVILRRELKQMSDQRIETLN